MMSTLDISLFSRLIRPGQTPPSSMSSVLSRSIKSARLSVVSVSERTHSCSNYVIMKYPGQSRVWGLDLAIRDKHWLLQTLFDVLKTRRYWKLTQLFQEGKKMTLWHYQSLFTLFYTVDLRVVCAARLENVSTPETMRLKLFQTFHRSKVFILKETLNPHTSFF